MTAQEQSRAKGLALALLAMTQFVVVLDASIVNVALPSIGHALDFSQDNLSWVVNAYTLTFGGFLLLGGRLADLLGRRRMFMAGLVLFSVSSLLGGLAQSEAWLIAARAAQGLGAALVSPAALSLVTTMFSEGAERNKALGVWGAVAGSGGAAGGLVRGMLTQWGGWGGGAAGGLAAAGGGRGVVPLRQRPDRPRRGGPGAPAAPREPRRRRRARLRRDGRRAGDRRSGAARLHARRRRVRGLDVDADARPGRAVARHPGRLRGLGVARGQSARALRHLPPAHAARRE